MVIGPFGNLLSIQLLLPFALPCIGLGILNQFSQNQNITSVWFGYGSSVSVRTGYGLVTKFLEWI